MASLNLAERTLELVVAWFGPLQAGCGTNVRHLHRVLSARERSELRRIGGSKDRQERMWSFVYHPSDPPRVPGVEVRIRVCSVPSSASTTLDRDGMIAGVDGLVFVADARSGRTDDNLAALLDLDQLLVRHGHELGELPMVFQVNQTDAQNARPTERVIEELNPFGLPVFEAMARQGKGVLPTHEAILAAVFARLRDNLQGGELQVSTTAMPRAVRDRVEEAILAHAGNLPQSKRPMPPSLGLPSQAEIPVRVPELRDSRPIQHVRAEIRGERLRVEGVYRRRDGTQRKLALVLEPGDDTPTPAAARRELPPPPARRALPLDDEPGDLSRMFYGSVGLLGGSIIGFLVHYIYFSG